MKNREYIEELRSAFVAHQDPKRAQAQKAYMRNQFAFYGLTAPIRKEVSRPFFAKEVRPAVTDLENLIREMWAEPHREFQFVAMELVAKYNKQLDASYFALLEEMITQKSWWDTVDYTAATLVGNLVKRFPEEGYAFIEKWRKSGNMWLVRTCIIFQLKYKDEVDEALLFSLIKENSACNEFFIRKAIGWSLRQYGKYKPERVRYFVDNHDLSGLSRREALKQLN